MSSTTTISHDKLARLVGTPACPVLIDVRIDEDYTLDPRLIPGSRRRSHKDIETWMPELVGKRAIIICQQGKNERGNSRPFALQCHTGGNPRRRI